MYNVQNVHSTCWFYQQRTVMYVFPDTLTLIPLVFPFLLTETSQVVLVNLFHRIARFGICNYVKGGGGRFWLVIFSYFSLYRRKKCPHSELFWSTFSCIRTEYSVSLRIQSGCAKMRTRITPNTNAFYAVYIFAYRKIIEP